jgi:hypothetical protein
MSRRRRLLAAGAGLILVAATSTACAGSHIHPSLAECAITTGHGYFSNQTVLHVTLPGGNTKLGSGTTTWYFPCGTRNYKTGPNGDRASSTPEITAPDKGVKNSAIYVEIQSFMVWTINPAISLNKKIKVPGEPTLPWTFANHFLQYCLKYPCATNSPQNDTANSHKLRNSDPGWLAMEDELIPTALDNATGFALAKYGPSIWTDHSQWTALGNAIAADLPNELQLLDGSRAEGMPDYFCGAGSTPVKCAPFAIQVSKVTPQDSGVVNAYQLAQQAAYQKQAAQERKAVAITLYGSQDAGWFIGMKDLVDECAQVKVTCNIYAGNAPQNPSSGK